MNEGNSRPVERPEPALLHLRYVINNLDLYLLFLPQCCMADSQDLFTKENTKQWAAIMLISLYNYTFLLPGLIQYCSIRRVRILI